MSSIISIKNLTKTFISSSERLTILSNLNLEIEEGKKVVIVGDSGSGKSTLLNIIGGIDNPTSGEIIAANGKWKVSELKEKQLAEYRSSFIGLIFQFHYLLKDFTALENVCMPAIVAGETKANAVKKARQLLEDVGISNRENHLPSQLSGGERQRVAVARALINNPSLILADEPTGNLDPSNAALISDLLFSMVEKYHKNLILVTHDMKIASKGDLIYKITGGKLEQTEISVNA